MDTEAADDERTDGAQRRRVRFEGVINFRDLGGYATASGGLTRWGLVFRSDALNRLTAADLVAYERQGIRVVYDLRSDDERELRPNPMTSRVIALESLVRRAGFLDDGGALKTAEDAERRLRDVYLAILATAGPLFGQLFSGLIEAGGLPAVFHCAGGKDRTGLAAALLLSSLGVDRETVLDDFELTNRFLTRERQREVVELFLARGMSPEAAVSLLGAPRWAMAEALSVLDDEHGGIEAYLRGPAPMGTDMLDALRRLLVGVSPAESSRRRHQ
jgi:protein-tyrosine phosphatase